MKIIKAIILFVLMFFIVLFCLFSNEVANSFVYTAAICVKSIIPSLLPVIFVSLLIINSNLTEILPKNFRFFGVFLLSCVSGYPVGAKLLDAYSGNNSIKKENATLFLPSFINAGPGFIINVIGYGILNSKKIGLILYFSQFFASFVIFVFLGGFLTLTQTKSKTIKLTDTIQKSAYDSVISVKNVCTYLILINCFSKVIELVFGTKISTVLIYLCEITSAVLKQNNVYAINILLSFCGLCVYLQIFSMVKNYKINFIKLLLCRVLHIFLSLSFLKILIKMFKVTIPVFSTTTTSLIPTQNLGVFFSVFLIFTLFCFILSVKRKSSGNLLKDLI